MTKRKAFLRNGNFNIPKQRYIKIEKQNCSEHVLGLPKLEEETGLSTAKNINLRRKGSGQDLSTIVSMANSQY